MGETVGKIEQLTEHDIFNPKLMTPRSEALWEWYKTVSKRLMYAIQDDDIDKALDMVEDIAGEIEAHAVEIEYQCRI